MTDKQCYNQNKKTISWLNNYKIGSGHEKNFNMAIEALKRANEALKGKQNGYWVFDKDYGYFSCSVCGRKPNDQTAITDFCPWCGAKMR